MIFYQTKKFISFNEFVNYLNDIKSEIIYIKSKKILFANIPATFDIETSSFYDNGEKRSIMYAFTFGINGVSILGRTWNEFHTILETVYNILELSDSKRLIIYVHNLSYEFQFIRKRFFFTDVFALSQREPAKAITNGFEFRCSYILSGYSLSRLGKNLVKYPCQKKDGDLDYRKIRHSKTPLTETEKDYILYDGLVVMSYIQEQIESHDNNITKLPLTKTGEIRNLCRINCLYGGEKSHKKNVNQFKKYHTLMLGTSIRSLEEYKQLRERAFYGGFTHANAFYNDDIVKNVTSFDFNSSYPYVMISEKYPTGKCYRKKIESMSEFRTKLDKYCCMFDITFYGLRDKIYYEHVISASHCTKRVNALEDNGRIVSADILSTTVTNLDFKIIEKFYSWDKFAIKNFRYYRKEYLPTEFVKTILSLYKNKTELKGIAGSEYEYLKNKELLNSCYGMTVTDILRTKIIYDGDKWKTQEFESEEDKRLFMEEELQKYNKKKNRFLAYQWGVWVTAYARYNLFSGIYNAGMNYIYSDTDSIKVRNAETIQPYIDNYNKNVVIKLQRAMNYHKLPFELCTPKTKDGKIKILGIWDNEGTYTRFKTLGAKRYMTEKDGEISLTVSGINKKFAIPYLKTLNKDLFDLFTENMTIPATYTTKSGELVSGTGKNIHTYIDDAIDGVIVDYLGNKSEYHELSCVHMEESSYNLTYSSLYVNYLLSIKTKEQ